MAGVPAREEEHVVVTMDAAHTQRDTADYLKGTRGFDYVMTVKGNQPTLLDSVVKKISPLLRNDPDHAVEERGQGRVSYWDTWISLGELLVLSLHSSVRPFALDGDDPSRRSFLESDKEIVGPQLYALPNFDFRPPQRPTSFESDVGIYDVELVVRVSHSRDTKPGGKREIPRSSA